MLNLNIIITNPPDGLSQMEVAYYIVAHRYIQCEANAAIKQELADAGLIITTYRLRHLVGEVEDWLGLSCDEKSLGRPSMTQRQRLLRRWKRVNGHPTLELLLAGWEPNTDWRSVAKGSAQRMSVVHLTKQSTPQATQASLGVNAKVSDDEIEQTNKISSESNNSEKSEQQSKLSKLKRKTHKIKNNKT